MFYSAFNTAFQTNAFQRDAFQGGFTEGLNLQFFIDDNWFNVTSDVVGVQGMTLDYGIGGAGPADLVAQTGRLTFTLRNDQGNTGGVVGYYSPESTNCRHGFGLGMLVRILYNVNGTIYYKFFGSLDEIDPAAGLNGERVTTCSASDYIDELARFRPNVATQVSARADSVLSALTTSLTRQPSSIDFDTADTSFAYSLDNSESERQSVLTEAQKIAQSEYGRIYMKGDHAELGGGVLTFEKRTARLAPTVVATFDNTMVSLNAPQKRGDVINHVKATMHPRRIDATATGVLASLQSVLSVTAGTTIKQTLTYNDPANRASRIGGTNMQTPASTTDYAAFTSSGGGGSNLTTGFSITASYGGNTVAYTIANGTTQDGFLTKLQARGQGLYDYDPILIESKSTGSIDAYGENQLVLDMPYQNDQNVAQAVADYIVQTWSTPGAIETRMSYLASVDSTTLTNALSLEPGDAIGVLETVTGINRTYFINHASLRFEIGGFIWCEYVLSRALSATFWVLDSTSKSQLDQTTIVAPF